MFELSATIGGKEYLIPDTIVNLWFIVIVLSVFALYMNNKIKKANIEEKPKGILNVMETFVQAVQNLVVTTVGQHNLERFGPYMFMLAMFLPVANLLGLVGLTPPTSDYSVTLSLALITFVWTQYWAFRNGGGLIGYIKGFFEPIALFAPINLLGEIGNPISLSFRLFGNIMSGGIIMALLYQALGFIAPIVAAPLHAYFDVFSGLLQTFIFIMLSMIFIGGADAEAGK